MRHRPISSRSLRLRQSSASGHEQTKLVGNSPQPLSSASHFSAYKLGIDMFNGARLERPARFGAVLGNVGPK